MKRREFIALLAGTAVTPKVAPIPSNWFPIRHVGTSPITYGTITHKKQALDVLSRSLRFSQMCERDRFPTRMGRTIDFAPYRLVDRSGE